MFYKLLVNNARLSPGLGGGGREPQREGLGNRLNRQARRRLQQQRGRERDPKNRLQSPQRQWTGQEWHKGGKGKGGGKGGKGKDKGGKGRRPDQGRDARDKHAGRNHERHNKAPPGDKKPQGTPAQ